MDLKGLQAAVYAKGIEQIGLDKRTWTLPLPGKSCISLQLMGLGNRECSIDFKKMFVVLLLIFEHKNLTFPIDSMRCPCN